MTPISSKLPFLLTIAVAVAMVSATVWQGFEFWQSELSGSVTKQPTDQSDQIQPRQKAPDMSLASVSLFGDEDPAQKAAPEADLEDLPETNLKLVLRGVMSATGDFPGSALIEDSERKTEAYIIGEELPGNATLKAVRPDRIIIERSGALENLYFPENEDRSGIEFAVNESADNTSATTETEYANQQARSASFPGPRSNPTSDSRREEIRQRLEQLRNRLRNNN